MHPGRRVKVPKALRGIVRGMYVGGCVHGKMQRDAVAHAHNGTKSRWFGWICFLEPHSPRCKGGPTCTLLHELAHLLVPDAQHGQEWRDMCALLVSLTK